MRRFNIFVAAVLATCMSITAYAQYGMPAPKNITATKEEITKMSETKAIIETKSGNIT